MYQTIRDKTPIHPDKEEECDCFVCGETLTLYEMTENSGENFCTGCIDDARRTCFECGEVDTCNLIYSGTTTNDGEHWMICRGCTFKNIAKLISSVKTTNDADTANIALACELVDRLCNVVTGEYAVAADSILCNSKDWR